MNRAAWLAAVALALVGTGAATAVDATAEQEPRPAPPRLYSSCLVADTEPVPVDADPCDGR